MRKFRNYIAGITDAILEPLHDSKLRNLADILECIFCCEIDGLTIKKTEE